MGPILATPKDKRTKKQNDTLLEHYLTAVDPIFKKMHAKHTLEEITKARDAILLKVKSLFYLFGMKIKQ